jgi:trk system potassium uptake protein TrkA
MNVIIMGCGRVGERVAHLMTAEGHNVIVIDYDQHALDRLGENFRGTKIKGIGFDRDTLIKAGIEYAEAFVTTSSSDNANIVAARIARTIFHVPRVIARLYDPRRAEIYRRLGLVTISSTDWGAERIHELLTHADLNAVMTFGNGEVSLVAMDLPPRLAGRAVNHLVVPSEINVVSITRQGRAFIPQLGTQFHEGDVLHLAVLGSAMERLEEMLGE